MARRSHARKTIFAAILVTAVAGLPNPFVLTNACAYADTPSPQLYSTALGESRRVTLARQLVVQMNTGTSFSVATSPALYEVHMDRGEALFELDKAAEHSLRIVAGHTAVTARTARFSVRIRDAQHTDVLVTAGQIHVGTLTVREKQLARVTPGSTLIRDLTEAETGRKLEWTTGVITFSGETLEDAIAEFNRYSARKLVVADRSIRSLTIGGKFRSTDVESFIAALRPMGIRRMRSAARSEDDTIRLIGPQGKD